MIIVDHGSRKSQSNQQLEQFCDLYQQVTGRKIVFPAHMEIASPTLMQAAEQCVEAGAQSIVVCPYFLSNGRHIQQDIPALVEEIRQRFADVQITLAEPIGVDPLMARLIDQRAVDAQRKAKIEADGGSFSIGTSIKNIYNYLSS